ncbi:gfo/Idh/MocA family oxidoreductase [Vibrio sp. CAIM 722]|uniref:Gfo/Idh/MocA family oxidoreductase n=1 Tax=Vibrio eleionomae TaxID=2653505 RepID=A0A7X4RWW9_9VIBR|nr:Gfo/Idh/MocA family oxidoreductase [Vibrio eleionomae]MZI95797.1 gfo/Idh/MocA family oxidoreductase [Vibrio eleionomae]
MIKFGFIGYGKMGKIRARAFGKFADVSVEGVYDVKEIKDSEYKVFNDPYEIINDKSIDAVSISVPNYYNFEYTMAALNQGKHVFCEKPPAFTSQQVKEIRAKELETGLKLMYGFNHRHHGAVMKMKTVIDSGEYGKVLWMRGRYGKSVDETYFDDWRSKKDLAGGGILFDQGIHMLDLFIHLGGTFDQVHAFVSSLYWKMEGLEDNVFAIMKNSTSGMEASLHSTMTQWRHLFSLEVFLESGYMVLNGLKTGSGTYGDEELTIAKNRSVAPAATWDDEARFRFETDNSWNEEAEHFINAIKNNTDVMFGNSNDALNVMELVESIYANERHESDHLYTKLKNIR